MNINDTAIQSRFANASKIIRRAGELASVYFSQLSTIVAETKANGQDVVSLADREAEKLIRNLISDAYPEDGLLGEEFGLDDGSSGFTWVVDPIDGTSCFAHGHGTWSVAMD